MSIDSANGFRIKNKYKLLNSGIGNGKIRNQFSIAFVCLIGFAISYMQIFGTSPDYSGYDAFFDAIRNDPITGFEESRFELLFKITSIAITAIISNNLIVYSIFVVFSLWLKSWLIFKSNPIPRFFLVVLIFYSIRFLPLHELTQIRAACSISLALISAQLIWKRKFVYGNIFLFAAVLFHASAIFIVPLIYICFKDRVKTIIFALATYILFYFISNIVSLHLGSLFVILDFYSNQGYSQIVPNLLGTHLLIDWTMIIYSIIIWSKLSIIMKRVIFIQLIGMAFFYSSFELGVIVHRVREFICAFWILYLADGLKYKRLRIFLYPYILICLVFYFYLNFFSGLIFKLD